jgi:HPt (histidine-containing phosphotransfer) domain-containing protein
LTAEIADVQSSPHFLSLPEPAVETRPTHAFPVLADVEAGAICWKNFAAFEAIMPTDEFRDLLASYLVDVELHLEQIARSRARQDFSTVVIEARCIAIQAAAFGAMRVKAAAERLERACESGALQVTYKLISELARTCEDAGRQLHNWLHSPMRSM